jgi:hypothetical protein
MFKIIIFLSIVQLLRAAELPVSNEDAVIELIRENRNLILLFRKFLEIKQIFIQF